MPEVLQNSKNIVIFVFMRSIDLLIPYLKNYGYTVRTFRVGEPIKQNFVQFTAPSGKHLLLSEDQLFYPFATSSAKQLLGDKTMTNDFVEQLGIPVPKAFVIHKKDIGDSLRRESLDFLHLYAPLVVKPFRSFGSRGLTINVNDKGTLLKALHLATKVKPLAIVQQQAFGEEYRFIVINGKIAGVLLRQKPCLIGDGRLNVRELLAKENESRLAIKNVAVAYPKLVKKHIKNLQHTYEYVPAIGERVELSHATMIRDGASVYSVKEAIDPSYGMAAEHIASELGDGMVCLDFIIQDASKPASSTNYIFLEANLVPSLHMCYSCRDGKHLKIVEDYLGPLLRNSIERI